MTLDGPATHHGRDLHADAISLTRRGYRAFPVGVSNGAKRPLFSRYHGDSPYSPRDLLSSQWDKATHIGIALRSDWLALDIDVKEGKAGEAHLNLLTAQYGPLPKTLEQMTLTGGRHLVFSRSAIPEAARLSAHAILPAGEPADIDVVHGRHRYLVVYNIDVWLTTPPGFPELPDRWHAAVLRRPMLHQSVEDQDPSLTAVDLLTLLHEVEQAPAGARNDTLNRHVFLATVHGYRGPSVGVQFLAAAQISGLAVDEAQTTISSATAAAEASWERVQEWKEMGMRHPDLQNPRRRRTLAVILSAICEVAVLKPLNGEFGMSCRDLAIRTGLSKNTTQKYLGDLVAHDLLRSPRWTQHENARRYSLKVPRHARKRDSPPSSPTSIHVVGLSNFLGGTGPTPGLDERILVLRRHSAFLRSVGHHHLPPSCADILAAIEAGYVTRRSILEATGRSRETVRKHLENLSQGCIIDQNEEDRTYHLTADTAVDALNGWAEAKHLPDRVRAKQARYAHERDVFRARHAEID